MSEQNLWQCTICGQVGTVGRCCGKETRIPVPHLLGEHWTHNELSDALFILRAAYEGAPVELEFDHMEELAKRGLLNDLKRLPGRGRYAKRYTFQETDKLNQLVKAAIAAGVFKPAP